MTKSKIIHPNPSHVPTDEQIALLIIAERQRQRRLWGGYRYGNVEHPDTAGVKRWGVLMEEIGEVGTAQIEGESIERVREELIQCGAVIQAWIESTY